MNTYRDELSRDYPELEDAPLMAIGCPHNWGYCDRADTPCGWIGRENVTRNHCIDCWAQVIDRPKPRRIEYKDLLGNRITNCVEKWFVHTYTRVPMCVVRVEYESGGVEFETITKAEFCRRWALSEEANNDHR